MTGIEPAFSAWEADVLPLNYTRRMPHPIVRDDVPLGYVALSRPGDMTSPEVHNSLVRS